MRPTIGLALIAKNEAENLPRLFKSFEGCFDEVHLTDTGSTDNTVEIAKSLGATVHHFEWVNDFAAARNYSFSHVNTDFIMWLDCDDVLVNKEAFLAWRDSAMDWADFWLNTYQYAMDNLTGQSTCSFARERVIRKIKGFKWNYFIHEGIIPDASTSASVHVDYANTWEVKHMRTYADLEKDKERNLSYFRIHKDKLDHRMRFYYGKELFEAKKPVEAASWLIDAAADRNLEAHDRLLAIEYACYCYMNCGQFNQAIGLALTGVQLSPQRAEYYCLAGDSYVKLGKLIDAIPMFNAAMGCANVGGDTRGYRAPIFTQTAYYTTYPALQKARCLANIGHYDEALSTAKDCFEKFKTDEAKIVIAEIEDHVAKSSVKKDSVLTKTDDIIMTCPPNAVSVDWDCDVLAKKGLGGSETAAIEMAHHLASLSGKKVILFNQRKSRLEKDGVVYEPVANLQEYLSKHQPRVHISWRHSAKLTDAPTYVWSHDLLTPGVEFHKNYDKLMCLTEAHKLFVNGRAGIPLDKIMVTRNGINPDLFKDIVIDKQFGKVIYSSSPDRGLDKAMRVMDYVVKEIPEATFHVFYGFDNMIKLRMDKEVERIQRMIQERPFVKYHGNVDKKELTKQFCSSQVWLYPTSFFETSCITAMEALACKAYPVVHDFGGLKDTLRDAKEAGMCSALDFHAETEGQIMAYADEVVKAIKEKKHDKIEFDLEKNSWRKVAAEWLETLLT